MNVVIDSNILIDFLQGREEARKELERYQNPAISRITWMELLIGTKNEKQQKNVEEFLSLFALIELDARVSRETVSVRRELGLKLPNAIILASARVNDGLLVTRNHRDFSPKLPEVRIPYR